MPKKINRNLSRHPERSEGSHHLAPWGEVKTLSEQSEHSVLGECSKSETSHKKIPRHPEFYSGSINGGRSPHMEKSPLIDSGSESGMTLRGSSRNNEVFCHSERSEGGQRPLLDMESTQDFPRHPERSKGSQKNNLAPWGEVKTLSEHSELSVLCEGCRRSPHITTCHRAHVARSQKAAFTLAEVLITLAIIGVVAALTIPSLIENHNEKAWSTAKDLWKKKLVEATRQMNIDGVMTGVASTTEDYMDIFKKYVKVIKTCDNNKLKNCYSPKIVQTAGEEVEVSDLKNSSNLGHDDWGTNTTGFVIADGTTVIMAYNPNCDAVDPFSKEGQSGQVGCMSMLIDVNGKKRPNKVGDDILLSNAVLSSCDVKLGSLGICSGGSDIYPITPINTCSSGTEEDQAYDERGDNYYCSTNYWAGAKKACDALDMRLPTLQELAEIANYIYKQEDNPIGVKETRNDISPDSARASELNWSIGCGYWSSVPDDDAYACQRFFNSSVSNYYWSEVGYSAPRARCVSK